MSNEPKEGSVGVTAPQEPLVKNLKRAGEQVLGAKPLTGNDHVRLSALLKVAALEIEALCAARDDAAELRAVLTELVDRVGYRSVEWAGVTTCSYCGADEPDFAHSEGCAIQKAEAALAATEGSE